MVLGIIIGIVGMIGCGVNYPIYKRILEKGKKKYAFDDPMTARLRSKTFEGVAKAMAEQWG